MATLPAAHKGQSVARSALAAGMTAHNGVLQFSAALVIFGGASSPGEAPALISLFLRSGSHSLFRADRLARFASRLGALVVLIPTVEYITHWLFLVFAELAEVRAGCV